MRRCSVRLSVLAVVLLGPLAAVPAGQPTPTVAAAARVPGAKVLRIQQGDYPLPLTLDPPRSYRTGEVAVSLLDYEGLTRLDPELTTVPGAAESWAFDAAGTVLTFRLRPGLTYADGAPLTAERFRYAVERACDPRTAADYAPIIFDVVGCEAFFTSLAADPVDEAAYQAARADLGVRALDDRTLEVRLVKPAAYFPTVASTWLFAPVQREVVERDPERWWRDPANRVGNGPFRVVAIEPDASPPRIAFAPNERYWGGRPKLDGIEYLYFGEDAITALAAYRRGELDIAWPEDADMPMVEADPALSRELLHIAVAGTFHLALNLTKEPFRDKKVREAFAYAFDRKAYCQEIAYGFCTPALSWIPPGVPGHVETDAYTFDPTAARRALAESTYGGPERLPEIVWYYNEADREDAREAEWLAAQYRAVLGVELTLGPISDEAADAMFFVDAATWPQLVIFNWYQDYPDPQNWLSVYWTCGSTIFAAYVGYCNPTFDELVGRADGELDPARRLALYQEAERLLRADVPSVFIGIPTNTPLVKPYVIGYATSSADHAWPGWTTPLTIDIAPAA